MSVAGFLAFVAALYFWWLWRRETARAAVPKPRRRRQREGQSHYSSVPLSAPLEIAPSLALVPVCNTLQRLNDAFDFEVFDDTFERGFLEIEYPIERPPQMAVVPFSAFPTSHNVLNMTYVIRNAGDFHGPLGDRKLNYDFAPFTKGDVFNSTFTVDRGNPTSEHDLWWDGDISLCECSGCVFGWDSSRQGFSEPESGEASQAESDTSGSDGSFPRIKLPPLNRRIGCDDFNPAWLKPTKTSKLREALAQKNKEENARSVKSGKRSAWR